LDWIISFASAVIASCKNGDKLDFEEPRYDRALQVQAVKKKPAETETDHTRSPNRLKEAAVWEEELQKTISTQ
jgi:hypothetical protein